MKDNWVKWAGKGRGRGGEGGREQSNFLPVIGVISLHWMHLRFASPRVLSFGCSFQPEYSGSPRRGGREVVYFVRSDQSDRNFPLHFDKPVRCLTSFH